MYKVKILVKSGKGGDGAISFHREKYHPQGGPDGGDGGKGGDVYLRADENITDLTPFRHQTVFKAGVGKNGGKDKKHGANGEDLAIPVPVGTAVYKEDDNSKTLLADLDRHNKKALVATGGNGGFGNVHFASPTHRTPRRANQGETGEEVRLILDYRLPLDVCIIGATNSGKSTLLSTISSAKPKVADYPFTTTEPVVGKAEFNGKSFNIGELPALIAGSSRGKGLGNSFLAHASRAKALVLLLDGSSESAGQDFKMLLDELSTYDPDLLKKPFVLAVNKADLNGVRERFQQMSKISNGAEAAYLVSALTGSGMGELAGGIVRLLKKSEAGQEAEKEPEVVFRPKPLPGKKLA